MSQDGLGGVWLEQRRPNYGLDVQPIGEERK